MKGIASIATVASGLSWPQVIGTGSLVGPRIRRPAPAVARPELVDPPEPCSDQAWAGGATSGKSGDESACRAGDEGLQLPPSTRPD